MSALTFPQQREPALVRSFVLAVIVHLALAAVLFFGVRWQSQTPEVHQVELWDAPPPPKVEAPKPPPPPPPPQKVEPEPPAPPKVDIVEKKKPEPKKIEKKIEPPKKEAPKRDLEFEKRLREQVAQEQKALDAERKERELKELLAKRQAEANRVLAQKALAEYQGRIIARLRANIVLPQDVRGNPEVTVVIEQTITGRVVRSRIVTGSGNPALDQALLRAVEKSDPLPLPLDPSVFQRELILRWTPFDRN